jgi:hypothetical protein
MTHTEYLRMSLDTMLSPTCLWLMHEYQDSVPVLSTELTTTDVVEGYLFTREGFTEDEASYAGLAVMYALV